MSQITIKIQQTNKHWWKHNLLGRGKNTSDVNKDWTCKDKDKHQAYKDQDKDKDKD